MDTNLSDENGEKVDRKPHVRDPLECYVKEEYFLGKINLPNKPEQNLVKNGSEEGKDITVPSEEGKKKNDKKQNKKRPIIKIDLSERLCNYLIDVAPGSELPKCTFPNCKMKHDLVAYLANKPEDLGDTCFVYNSLGYCPRGLSCRFSNMHIDKDGRNLRKEGTKSETLVESQSLNKLGKDTQTRLRKKQYNFKLSDGVCESKWDIINARKETTNNSNEEPLEKKIKLEENSSENGTLNKLKLDETDINGTNDDESPCKKIKVETTNDLKKKLNTVDEEEPQVKKIKTEDPEIKKVTTEKRLGPVSDEDLIKVRPEEKRKLDWEGKTYLAPLTTVGNLPFRRLCKRLGADITCGEMALALPILQGQSAEWALMKKHQSEDFFGVQLCGCSPPQMARVAQVIEEHVDCDFVDINMGCPIDLIYKKGMGSALMARKRPLENIVRTMSSVLTRPLTVKMRTGIYSDKSTAHEIFPLVEEWGASALTLHGRSREQRYTKMADWDYVSKTAGTVNIPVIGNGDVMNFEDYNLQRTRSGLSGVMLARGALIKPWVFTEIKDQRHWDISAQERLDIYKEFCNYGLEHWGSDDKGVENTRRFLLEWLSFTHRYVPHGILEYPPQRINERAPPYRGRNDLETLLQSPDSNDWVSITEMILGKVRPDFQFNAKHKANSYS